MSNDTCILTTKDFTILEVMRDRCIDQAGPLAMILKRKIESATVIFRSDVPEDVATLSSRVTFSVDGRDPDTRVISHDRMSPLVGLFLPITSLRGLALLGLAEGEHFIFTNGDGEKETILMDKVHYQPEAARRAREAMERLSGRSVSKPFLRLIRGTLHDQPSLVAASHDGNDDPGPSVA